MGYPSGYALKADIDCELRIKITAKDRDVNIDLENK